MVKLPAGTTIEPRDGVGLDRVMGAAAERVKYNRAVLPSGPEIELDMTVEFEAKNEAARSYIVVALQALQRGEIRFGAAKTRGLGQVTFKDLSVCEQDLLSFRGILNALRHKHDALDVKSLSPGELRGNPAVPLKLDWTPPLRQAHQLRAKFPRLWERNHPKESGRRAPRLAQRG